MYLCLHTLTCLRGVGPPLSARLLAPDGSHPCTGHAPHRPQTETCRKKAVNHKPSLYTGHAPHPPQIETCRHMTVYILK